MTPLSEHGRSFPALLTVKVDHISCLGCVDICGAMHALTHRAEGIAARVLV